MCRCNESTEAKRNFCRSVALSGSGCGFVSLCVCVCLRHFRTVVLRHGSNTSRGLYACTYIPKMPVVAVAPASFWPRGHAVLPGNGRGNRVSLSPPGPARPPRGPLLGEPARTTRTRGCVRAFQRQSVYGLCLTPQPLSALRPDSGTKTQPCSSHLRSYVFQSTQTARNREILPEGCLRNVKIEVFQS